jgi:hypothetical protein
VLDGELTARDDAFGLVADVEQDLVAVDLDDRALDDVAIVEVLDGRVDGSEEVLFRADVVDGDLRCARRQVVRRKSGSGGHKEMGTFGWMESYGRTRSPFHNS